MWTEVFFSLQQPDQECSKNGSKQIVDEPNCVTLYSAVAHPYMKDIDILDEVEWRMLQCVEESSHV